MHQRFKQITTIIIPPLQIPELLHQPPSPDSFCGGCSGFVLPRCGAFGGGESRATWWCVVGWRHRVPAAPEQTTRGRAPRRRGSAIARAALVAAVLVRSEEAAEHRRYFVLGTSTHVSGLIIEQFVNGGEQICKAMIRGGKWVVSERFLGAFNLSGGLLSGEDIDVYYIFFIERKPPIESRFGFRSEIDCNISLIAYGEVVRHQKAINCKAVL